MAASTHVLAAALACAALAAGAPAAAQPLNLQDLAFTPLAPCRILDTRAGSGVQGAGAGPLQPNVPFAFDVTGLCGVPIDVKAAVLNFVAVGPAGPGHLTVWPWDNPPDPEPNASVINYAQTGGLNIANGVVMQLCDAAEATAVSCTLDLFAEANVSAAHLVVDVSGYFAAPGTGPLWGQGRPGATRYDQGGFSGLCANGPYRFGLSHDLVTCENVASSCPAGTWVCTEEQRGTAPCDTGRPDTTCDALSCALGCLNITPSTHTGWLADRGGPIELYSGRIQAESGGPILDLECCRRFPVWCCSF